MSAARSVAHMLARNGRSMTLRRRTGTSGFKFFIHDLEQSLGLEAGTNQRVPRRKATQITTVETCRLGRQFTARSFERHQFTSDAPSAPVDAGSGYRSRG